MKCSYTEVFAIASVNNLGRVDTSYAYWKGTTRSAQISNLTKPNISANENFRGNMNMTRYLQGTRIQVHER